jgi:LuxR family transcriptional regulator, maltose regulon positive regulatory protein
VATNKGIENASERVAAPEAVVLETKLTRPHVRPQHVPRRELLAVLGHGSPRLTLVAAPPGFGKTTLLAEWAAAEDGPAVAWLSLDEDDNDPARFFEYLVAALRRVDPELGGRAVSALHTPGADLDGVVLPLFVNELSVLARDVVLVVDDYHLIRNPQVHRALAYLIERSPVAFHVVLATREDPPLPLAKLRARAELTEIRAGELRFSDEEAAAFVTDVLGLELSAEDVARLQARTEGWPAALYLAALSLRGRPDASSLIDAFAGDDRHIVDYLTAEVLARQPPELRSFLLQTSILRRLCGPLCDAVADRDGSASLLAELERSNLLLVALDTKREWYRYHHLFGELLQYELAATAGEVIPTLHRRASTWYREAGLIIDAAHHATAAGDVDAAVELVARHYAFFVGQGQLATVMRWLAALPAEVATQDWLLCFAGGVVSAHSGQLDEAERWLDLAERAPPVVRDGQEPTGPLAALAGYLRLLRGDIGGTVDNARRALAAVPATEPLWALTPQMVLAPGLWWAGQLDEAKTVLEAATRSAQAAGISATAVYALGIRAAIALDEQDERAAEILAREAIESMRRADLDEHPWSAMAHIVHGRLLGRHDDPEGASDEIERGIAFGERLRAWQLVAYGSLALAEVRQRQHQPAAARRLLAHVRDLLEQLPDPGDGFSRLAQTEKTLRLRAARDRGSAGARYWELSARELDVLRLLPSSLSQREIASELYVSFNTVRTHTRVIFRKLAVTSRAEAVARARDLGLL